MEELKGICATDHGVNVRIRTRVQSLAAHHEPRAEPAGSNINCMCKSRVKRRLRTLNDTELRENFRRKDTPRKYFLGHAQALIDLLTAAAKRRPTRRCAAHGGKHAGPQSAATSVSM